jgi:hypothetical protein
VQARRQIRLAQTLQTCASPSHHLQPRHLHLHRLHPPPLLPLLLPPPLPPPLPPLLRLLLFRTRADRTARSVSTARSRLRIAYLALAGSRRNLQGQTLASTCACHWTATWASTAPRQTHQSASLALTASRRPRQALTSGLTCAYRWTATWAITGRMRDLNARSALMALRPRAVGRTWGSKRA